MWWRTICPPYSRATCPSCWPTERIESVSASDGDRPLADHVHICPPGHHRDSRDLSLPRRRIGVLHPSRPRSTGFSNPWRKAPAIGRWRSSSRDLDMMVPWAPRPSMPPTGWSSPRRPRRRWSTRHARSRHRHRCRQSDRWVDQIVQWLNEVEAPGTPFLPDAVDAANDAFAELFPVGAMRRPVWTSSSTKMRRCAARPFAATAARASVLGEISDPREGTAGGDRSLETGLHDLGVVVFAIPPLSESLERRCACWSPIQKCRANPSASGCRMCHR